MKLREFICEAEWIDNFSEKYVAIALHVLDGDTSLLEETIAGVSYNDNIYTILGCTYLVFTDHEADGIWERYLDQYLDEYILRELPDICIPYIDRDVLKNGIKLNGGRGCLSIYDGIEHEVLVNNRWYYIFRMS